MLLSWWPERGAVSNDNRLEQRLQRQPTTMNRCLTTTGNSCSSINRITAAGFGIDDLEANNIKH